MGFSLAPLGKKLNELGGDVGRFFGGAADAVIPGDQSNWHRPAPAPVVSTPQRIAASQIGGATGFGPLPINSPPVQPSIMTNPASNPATDLFRTTSRQPLVPHGPVTALDVAREAVLGVKNTVAQNIHKSALDSGISQDPVTGKVTIDRDKFISHNNDIGAGSAMGMEKKGAQAGADAVKAAVNKIKAEAKMTGPTPDWPTDGLPGPEVKPFTEAQRTGTGVNNPVKVSIPDVQIGDHAKAISNSQRAADLVDKAAKFAFKSGRALSFEDQKLLPRAIEHPELIPTAKDPVKLKLAIADDKMLHDTAHAVNQELKGEPTAYRANHALHDWVLPEDMPTSPDTFRAINEQARVHPTLEHGEAAGLTLNPRGYIEATKEYAGRTSSALRRQALVKGITEAEGEGVKATRSFDLGGGSSLPVSDKAKVALRGLEPQAKRSVALKTYDSSTSTMKKILLSATQFHPINISRKAGSAMALSGHPLRAAKGVTDTFLAINKHYSNNLERRAFQDGTYDAAARIGTPIGISSDYSVTGELGLGKHGLGEKTIFERQMPALHVQLVKSLLSDFERKGISLDSKEARAAGTRINEIMGFVNVGVRGLDARTQRGLGRISLAPQFTRSKWATLKGVATDQGLARKYAIGAVLGDTAAVFTTATALGILLGQKQDDVRDTLIRSLIHPSVATPFKDAKGNNIELSLPSTYMSEAVGLLASLKRDGGDGTPLGISVSPGNLPGNVANYGRSRLNVPLADALKVFTNTDYAGKPLYDSTADFKTKVQQAATTITAGNIPIGGQALAHSEFVKDHLPAASAQVLEQGGNGVNPLVSSAAAAVGLTPRTDKTTGKGLGTTQFFAAQDKFAKSLDPAEATLFNKLTQGKKDGFGNVIKETTTLTKPSDYEDLLANPDFSAKFAVYNKAQPSHDPLWDLTNDQRRAYMQAQVISKNDPGGDSTTTSALYKRLPSDFFDKRSAYFDQLKSSGVSVPEPTTAQRPKMPDNLVAFSESYHNLPYGTGARSAALKSAEGQAYIAYLNQNKIYNNQERADLGLPPLEDSSSKYGGGSGSGTAKAKTADSFDREKYAVSLNAGGTIKKPKVSIKASSSGGKGKKVAKARPKVSIKKSLV